MKAISFRLPVSSGRRRKIHFNQLFFSRTTDRCELRKGREAIDENLLAAGGGNVSKLALFHLPSALGTPEFSSIASSTLSTVHSVSCPVRKELVKMDLSSFSH